MSVTATSPALRIAWIIPLPIIGSGGYTNILRIINLLATFGHDNVIYMQMHGIPPEYADQPERFIRRHFGPIFATVKPWPEVIDEVDVALATQWGTFEVLERCAPGVTRAYFVQDFEPFFYAMGYEYLKAEATYRAGVPCITLGHWLGTFLREEYGATTYPFDFAVEHELYYPRPELQPKRHRLLFYARPSTPRRCFDLGLEALTLVHERHPEAEIVLFGDQGLAAATKRFPFLDKGILGHRALAELYASATIGLVLSPTNPSLMPPELMASRCAVVDLDLPPNHFLIEHNRTGLLAPAQPQALADAVCRLIEDATLREQLIADAEKHVKQFSWERSAQQVEAALLTIAESRTRKTPAWRLDIEQASGEGTTPPLSSTLTVGQRFVPRHNDLSRIAVAVARPGLEVPLLQLYDTLDAEQPILQSSAAHLEDDWLVYDFQPLPASRHQPLYVTFSAMSGPQLRFDYRPTGGGSLAYNHVPQPGLLVFRAYCQQVATTPQAAGELLQSELDYLATRQSVAGTEQQLLSAYAAKAHHHAPSAGGWTQRASRAIKMVRQGQLGDLVHEARSYMRWTIANFSRRK